MVPHTLGGNNAFNGDVAIIHGAENRLSGVSGAATNSYSYDGDSKRVKEVTYENLAAGIPLTSSGSLYFAEVGTDGDTYPDSGESGSGEYAYVTSGNHYAQLDLGALNEAPPLSRWAGGWGGAAVVEVGFWAPAEQHHLDYLQSMTKL